MGHWNKLKPKKNPTEWKIVCVSKKKTSGPKKKKSANSWHNFSNSSPGSKFQHTHTHVQNDLLSLKVFGSKSLWAVFSCVFWVIVLSEYSWPAFETKVFHKGKEALLVLECLKRVFQHHCSLQRLAVPGVEKQPESLTELPPCVTVPPLMSLYKGHN